MDAISEPECETVVVMSSAQVGKTEILLNVVGFHVEQDPAPMLVVMPTLEMAQAWSKDRLAPMFRDTPALKGRIADSRTRDSGNTILHKTFPGGHLTASGANSPASLASRPVRIVLLDEVDRYPASAGAEGDPVNLATKRNSTFWNRKRVMTSTPTIKDASRIEAAYEASDKRRFFVPCPDCGEHQILRWSQVQWPSDPEHDPDAAVYVCEHCGSCWDDAARWRAVRAGEWRATAKFKGTAGFHLNEIYSPWVRLAEMVAAFLEAKKLPETLKTFVNTSLGETWEDKGETVEAEGLMTRGEDYEADLLPEGVVVLTAGVDVQDDRLEIEIYGEGLDAESWSINYIVLDGDPSGRALWDDLEDLLLKEYPHPYGRTLKVVAAAIDSGGHHTQAVYDFVRPVKMRRRRVWAIKGMGGAGRNIWPAKPSRNNVGRIALYVIGVDSAKERIYSRLAIEEPGPGYCHFPDGEIYDERYFAGLTSEKVVTKYSKGFPVRQWTPKSKNLRNEPLDCRVYALSALVGLNANMKKLAARLKARSESEALAGTAETEPPAAPPEIKLNEPEPEPKKVRRLRRRRPRRGKGFVGGWKS